MKQLCCLLALFLLASCASAQTVTLNPTQATFTASPDHATLDPNGVPLVTQYDLKIALTTTTGTVVYDQNLGKPTPDATNTIAVSLDPALMAAMVKNQVYQAVVSVAGSAGSAASAPSNPFASVAPARPAASVKIK